MKYVISITDDENIIVDDEEELNEIITELFDKHDCDDLDVYTLGQHWVVTRPISWEEVED